MIRRLQRGDYVRVRMAGDEEWTEAFVALASPTKVASVMLMFDGAVRAPGGIVVGSLPLTVDYEAETVVGLMGGDYEIQVVESI